MEPILFPEMSATNQPTLFTNPEGGRSQVRRVESLQPGWCTDKVTRSWLAALEGQESSLSKLSIPALEPTQRSFQWSAGKLITHIRPVPRLRTSAAVQPYTFIVCRRTAGQESYFCKVSTPALEPIQRSSQSAKRELTLGKSSR